MRVIVFFLLSASFAWAADPFDEVCDTQSIMATAWTICLIDPKHTKTELRRFIDGGMEIVREIDGWMSEWKPKSLISQINANAGIRPVRVTDEALDAIVQSLHHSELTGGAFDITFNAFFGKYSWKKGYERFPTDDEIEKLLPLVNYKNVIVDKEKKTIFLAKKGMKIGLGGMGQGWAVDKVFDRLKPYHIQAGYIDGSGDTYFWGRKPDGRLWTVGIGDPRPKIPGDTRSILYKMYLTDMAVTTAGDTEHYFIRDGKRYHHIIDPHTGYSADKSAQVTAVCKTATLCDFADDGIFILGSDEGRKYAEKIGVEAIVIDPGKKVSLTKGLKFVDTKWGPAIDFRRDL